MSIKEVVKVERKTREEEEIDQAVIDEKRAAKIAARKAAEAKKALFAKNRDRLATPALSSSSFYTGAWMATHCHNGKDRQSAVTRLSIDAQREDEAFHRFGLLQPW